MLIGVKIIFGRTYIAILGEVLLCGCAAIYLSYL